MDELTVKADQYLEVLVRKAVCLRGENCMLTVQNTKLMEQHEIMTKKLMDAHDDILCAKNQVIKAQDKCMEAQDRALEFQDDFVKAHNKTLALQDEVMDA